MTNFAALFFGLLVVGLTVICYVYWFPIWTIYFLFLTFMGYAVSKRIPWRKPNFTATNTAYLGTIAAGSAVAMEYHQFEGNRLRALGLVCALAFFARWTASLLVNWDRTWMRQTGNVWFVLTLMVFSFVGGVTTSSYSLLIGVAEVAITMGVYLISVKIAEGYKEAQLYLWIGQFIGVFALNQLLVLFVDPNSIVSTLVALVWTLTQFVAYLLALATPWSASPARLPTQMREVRV